MLTETIVQYFSAPVLSDTLYPNIVVALLEVGGGDWTTAGASAAGATSPLQRMLPRWYAPTEVEVAKVIGDSKRQTGRAVLDPRREAAVRRTYQEALPGNKLLAEKLVDLLLEAAKAQQSIDED